VTSLTPLATMAPVAEWRGMAIYNVRCKSWHTILLSRDASVLIVEEGDTGEHNSEFASLPARLCAQIVELARNENIADASFA